MSRFTKLVLAAAVVVGSFAGVGASTAQAGDFCFGHGCHEPVYAAPVYVAPVCVYKVFYIDHCGHYRCYNTYHSLFAAQRFAHRLDCLGYHTIIKTIH